LQVVAAVAMLGIVMSACSSSSKTSGGTSNTTARQKGTSNNLFDATNFNPPWLNANVNATGTPKTGGTLKLEGSTDLSGAADPQGEYETIGYELERLYTRQLVTYPGSSDVVKADTIVADAATDTGTVSADGLTYTFHIKPGVMWDTSPPRQVTSQDFELGLKRNCDPTLYPLVNPAYYTATIKGFSAFCTPFQNMDPKSTAQARAAYINNPAHSISGISTPDSSTIIFTLTQPAADFDYILAFPFSGAAPVEDLQYVPTTPGNPIYSDGPYKVSNYNVGHSMTLTPNTAWQPTTDSVRHQYVSEVDVKLDLAGAAAGSQVQQDMQAGTADLQFNTPVPTTDIAGLMAPTWNAQFGAFPAPGITNPYLIFNVQSPNNGGALGNVKVRQALTYAIDKVAMGKIYGGSNLNQALNQVIAPGAQGYVPFNPYPTANNQGDPAKCQSMLAAAGVKNLTLKDYYRNSGNHPAVFEEVQSDFKKCGVTVVGTPIATGYYSSKGIGVTGKDGLKAGKWDITEPGWVPDWFGPDNGRATLPDLFASQNFPGTNWGGYASPTVDNLITQALAAKTTADASALWHQADQAVMADAPFVPFQTQLTTLFRSARVHNALWSPFSSSYDLSQIWLS
jgi:peptide/nickel transport system substrate-binding protein